MKVRTLEKTSTNSLVINDTYEIDLQTGTVYYAHAYCGNRNKDFPQYVFDLAEVVKAMNTVKV